MNPWSTPHTSSPEPQEPVDSPWSRHPREIDIAEAHAHWRSPKPPMGSIPPGPSEVFWALQNIPIEQATRHFCVMGATGSGKTVAMDLLLQSIAYRFLPDSGCSSQLIIYDAKGDVVPKLAKMGLRHDCHDNFWIMNPFDRRGAPWDIAKAAVSPSMARYIATQLVPEEPNSQSRYFSDSAREIILWCMSGLSARHGTNWTFRDLICALDSRERILQITSWHSRASRRTRQILSDTRHAFGVLSTLASRISRFETIAGLWHQRSTAARFSVESFVEKPGVLVLGYDTVLSDSLWPINAIVIKALADELLRRRDSNPAEPKHWFFLDEFASMKDVPCVVDLLNRGRSKSVSVVLGIQNIRGLVRHYGEHGADDILGACANKMFLRAGEPRTADWIEQYFGKIRDWESSVNDSAAAPGGNPRSAMHVSSNELDARTYGVQRTLQDRPMFLASYFMNLPFTGRGRRYKAVCDLPYVDSTHVIDEPFDSIVPLLLGKDEEVQAVDRVSGHDIESMQDWTDGESKVMTGGPQNAVLPNDGGEHEPPIPPLSELPGFLSLDTEDIPSNDEQV